MCTSLLAAEARAQQPSQAAHRAVERAVERSLEIAHLPAPEEVVGWRVAVRSGEQQPAVVATRGGWTIVADERVGDRLVEARLIGPEFTLWATSAQLEADGVTLSHVVSQSVHHTIRATSGRLILEPEKIELRGIGSQSKPAE